MKMDIFTSGLFWGVFLVLTGAVIIIRVVFHIEIPVMRIVFALFLIILGVKLLVSAPHARKRPDDTTFFSQETMTGPGGKEHNVVFGKGIYDLRGTKVGETKNVHYNTVFGGSVIKLSPDVPVLIRADSVFAEARFPDGNSVVFGSYTYRSKDLDESRPHLRIKADVVFGELVVKEEK